MPCLLAYSEETMHCSLALGGVGCMVVPLCSTIWQIILAITLSAFGIATFRALISTLMADDFGAELTASTWGFLSMVQGICGFIYPSLLGKGLPCSRFLLFSCTYFYANCSSNMFSHDLTAHIYQL